MKRKWERGKGRWMGDRYEEEEKKLGIRKRNIRKQKLEWGE
jgi:hypothetical protein